MNEFLKRFVPIKLKHTIKLGISFFEYKKRVSDIGKQCGVNLLVGTPLHKNLGDHLIALAERQYLHDIGIEQVIEIPLGVFWVFEEAIKKNKRQIARVFISGGGWMGNLWPEDEKAMLNMVAAFDDMPMVVFPQTIFWDSKKEFSNLMEMEKSVMNGTSQMIFCAREKQTFDYVQKNYYKSKNLLLPDIALRYKRELRDVKKVPQQVGICLRSDVERTTNVLDLESLVCELKKRAKKTVALSTMANKNVSEKKREDAVNECINEFASCSCIITDRLHGMIISVLAGVPCIVSDNKTMKVSGVYETWLRKCNLVRMIDDKNTLDYVCDLVDELMIINDGYEIDFNNEFDVLSEELFWKI